MRYDDLKTWMLFSSDYRTKRDQHQEELQDLLADNGQKDWQGIKVNGQEAWKRERTAQTAGKQLSKWQESVRAGRKSLENARRTSDRFHQNRKESQIKGHLTKAKEELATKKKTGSRQRVI